MKTLERGGRMLLAMENEESKAIWNETSEPPNAFVEDDAAEEEDLRVNAWRAEQLYRLGLSWLTAESFAALVDWHEVAELVERGCSPELALEIAL